MDKSFCPICDSKECQVVYYPRGSRVELKVLICNQCQHVHAVKSQKNPKPLGVIDVKISRVSCNADYSEVRVGKQQMTDVDFDRYVDFLNENPEYEVSNILDSCSARGHFINKLATIDSNINIYAIEPDAYMTSEYIKNDRFDVFVGEIDAYEEDVKFDFIYSCHTLEHYKKPGKIFQFISRYLRSDGVFFVNVPNLESLDIYPGIDEYFYDYHLQYFSEQSLVSLAEKFQFKPIRIFKDSSLAIMFSRSPEKFQNIKDSTSSFNSIALIEDYASRMEKHFFLRNVAKDKIDKVIKEHQGKVGIFGAGRVLDFFVTYCNFDIENKNLILIDNFLRNGTDELYGKKLYRFSEVGHSDISLWIVFSNSSISNISNLIRSRFDAPIYSALSFFEVNSEI